MISNVLFRSGYIEAWGRGTINMINECAKRNIPRPNYKYDYSGFIVEFNNSILKNEGVNEGVKDIPALVVEIVKKHPVAVLPHWEYAVGEGAAGKLGQQRYTKHCHRFAKRIAGLTWFFVLKPEEHATICRGICVFEPLETVRNRF